MSTPEPAAGAGGGPTARGGPTAGGTPRVVLVDDHGLFRSGVRSEIGDRVTVVGEAADVAPAIALITQTRPDVVLLDVHLPGGGGQAVISAIKPGQPQVRFLALSASDAPEDVIAVIRAGARGYVTKTISGTELVDAVLRVAAGDAVFSPRLAGFVLDAFAALPQAAGQSPSFDPELDQLTARGTGGAAADRAGVHLPGDRPRAVHLGQDGGKPRLLGAAQAAALHPPPADPLGRRAAAELAVVEPGRVDGCRNGARRRPAAVPGARAASAY